MVGPINGKVKENEKIFLFNIDYFCGTDEKENSNYLCGTNRVIFVMNKLIVNMNKFDYNMSKNLLVIWIDISKIDKNVSIPLTN